MDLPGDVAAWVVGAVDRGARIRRVSSFPRASTSAVHAVDVETADGRLVRVVLRRYVDPDVLASEPEPVRREQLVLQTLEPTPVAAPRVLGTDPDGEACGVPALLMTRLPGRARWHARARDRFAEALAAQLPAIHATPVPSGGEFPGYHGYHRHGAVAVPPWSRNPDAWAAAIELHGAGPPSHAPTFIHRDYHPGNVLWRSTTTITGIVDWAWACRGPALVDVAHCRLNLVLAHGIEVADEFLDRWLEVSSTADYDTAWDLLDAVDAVPHLVGITPAARQRLDDWVIGAARALPG